ncbi:MAG: DUF2249 domain-containing protein [Weeksellaceae bacterium]|nr:DUF2249 domain-containing protein [Weeksellaceae bacterium]
MLINEQTKIAALLKHNSAALEAIVSLSPDFKKLRSPLLRKLMAGRTSIKMASKIGGCKPEDFFKVLHPLGFEADLSAPKEEEKTEKKPLPDYLKSLKSEQIIEFDVRQMLADGGDPLRPIQQKIKELPQNHALKIINTFEPVPLISLLEKQGFETFVDAVGEERIDTYFYKTSADSKVELETVNNDAADWDQILASFKENLVEIDVRHLEMPMPMMTILEALEELPDEKALYVYHKRIPVFLLTELKDRNFDYRIKEVQDGEVYLLIFKTR